MFFLNLSLPEFVALLGSLSGVVVALYLLDRLRKKHTVATLEILRGLRKAAGLEASPQAPAALVAATATAEPAAAPASYRATALGIAGARLARSRVDFGFLGLDECALGTSPLDRPGPRRRPKLRQAAALERPRDGGPRRCCWPRRQHYSNRTAGKIRQAIDQTQPGGSELNIGAGAGIREASSKNPRATGRRDRVYRRRHAFPPMPRLRSRCPPISASSLFPAPPNIAGCAK